MHAHLTFKLAIQQLVMNLKEKATKLVKSGLHINLLLLAYLPASACLPSPSALATMHYRTESTSFMDQPSLWTVTSPHSRVRII